MERLDLSREFINDGCVKHAVACSLLVAVAACGQESTGTVNGHVRDASGLGVAGAEVTALATGTGSERKALTGRDGSYALTSLPIGAYRITVTHPGFKKAVRNGVDLHIGDHLSLDISLELGEVSQQVDVEADSAQVETGTSEQGQVIYGEQVRELQLNGRSFMTLLELLPGVASNMPDRTDPNSNPALSINGARSSSATFAIDGGNNSDVIVGSGSLNTFTSVETISEFKVASSTFAAEYGRGGFAQVNVVTKGGTKNFHGSLFEFFRNDALDATDFFSHQTLPLKLNNFGLTIGGPVMLPWYNRDRKKTFFFFTQEFNYLSTRGASVNTTVPTATQRSGNFSGVSPAVLDPTANAVFPGGIIPPSRMDPNAVKLLNLYPAPNFNGPGAINYTSAAASQQRWREELIRIDHLFSPAWKIYGRYAQDSADIDNPYGGTSVAAIGNRFPGISATTATRPGKNLTVNLTTMASQSMLNEFSFTWAGREITQAAVNDNANRSRLGISIPEIFPENIGNIIPAINLGSGYAALSVARYYLKQLFNTELSDNVTKIRGRHIFKMGAIYSNGGNRENPSTPNTNGSFSFTTNFSRNPVANMLLGLPFSYTEAEHLVVSNVRFGFFEAFVQDDWKVAPRLTLNVGIRYASYFNPWDTNNVLTNFLPSAYDPARAPQIDPKTGQPIPGTGDPLNGIIIAGKNSPYGRLVTNNNDNLLGPRMGFSWDPLGKKKSVLRSGFGVYYTRPLIGTFINDAFDNPPFSHTVTINTPPFGNPTAGVQAASSAPTLTALGVPMKAPTIQQWNVGVQQEILRRAILSISYVGSRGWNLMRPLTINDPAPGAAAAIGLPAAAVNAVRPYLGYGIVTERQDTASSIYHSLQVSFNRRFSGRYSVGTAYTFSKSIDNGSSERNGIDVPPDSRNPNAERAPSDFDRTHVLTANFIWNAPNLIQSRVPGALLNGWEFSGILRFYTGNPLNVQLSSDVAGIGAVQNQRPNVIANTRGPKTVAEWFNNNAFARPKTGTFGNMGRNSVRGPGINKWDLSLFKNFRWTESVRLQFRSEFFNAFNHPSFDTIGTSLNTTSTGVNPNVNSFAVVTATRDARVLQFGLKLLF